MRPIDQQNAPRANGAKSHGPITPEGKAKSAQNRTTHGLFSAAILLQPENESAWRRLQDDLITRFRPADPVEHNLTYEMAVATWRGQRANLLEAELVNLEIDRLAETEPAPESPQDEIRRAAVAYANAIGRSEAILELGRMSIRLGRHWMRLRRELTDLQKLRKSEEHAAPALPAPQPLPEPSPEPPVPPESAAGPNEANPPAPPPIKNQEFEPSAPAAPAAKPAAPTPTPSSPWTPFPTSWDRS